VNRVADNSSSQWFGLSHSQFVWAVVWRVTVAAVIGAVVYVVTSGVLWLIVALLATSVIINAATSSRTRR